MALTYKLTTAEAASLLGCHIRHVAYLLRTGRLRGSRVSTGDHKFEWRVSEVSVHQYKILNQPCGWKRGLKRHEV